MSRRPGRTPATPPPRARPRSRGGRRRSPGRCNRLARAARPSPAPRGGGPPHCRCVIAIRVARPVTAPHPRARRARALQPPPPPAVRRARWKPRLRSAHFHDAPPRVRRNVQDRIRLRSPRLSGGATFETQRQLVAESLVFDRCRNERGSSTALTSAASYRRISIPHLGFRYGYWSAAGSLNAGVRVCSGGCREFVAPEGAAT